VHPVIFNTEGLSPYAWLHIPTGCQKCKSGKIRPAATKWQTKGASDNWKNSSASEAGMWSLKPKGVAAKGIATKGYKGDAKGIAIEGS
jgi:hypothetical protein